MAGRGGSRSGGGGGGGGFARPEPVINLEKYMEKRLRVRFVGGREVVGTLKGFDGLVNVVLDDTTEELPAPAAGAGAGAGAAPATTRYLGLVVCRGPHVLVVGPDEGLREIANPFGDEGDGEAEAEAEGDAAGGQ